MTLIILYDQFWSNNDFIKLYNTFPFYPEVHSTISLADYCAKDVHFLPTYLLRGTVYTPLS